MCALAFGFVAVLWPGLGLASVVILFAAYLVVDGVLAVASAAIAARRKDQWTALALEGFLDLAAAVVVLTLPALTMLVTIYVAAFWAVLSGSALPVASARFGMGEWLLALAAAASILLGCLLFLAPIQGTVTVARWLGIYALVFGTAFVGLAWKLRHTVRGGVLLKNDDPPWGMFAGVYLSRRCPLSGKGRWR